MADMFGRDDIALGVALPFGPGLSNFKLNYTTLDQAKTNIINLLLTHKGERFMQPDFGTNLRRYLFQPNNNQIQGELKTEIMDAISFWLPYVKVQTMTVDNSIENIDQYKINITLTFSVTEDITEFTSVTFKFNSDGSVGVTNL
tara:strand:- start:1175 stop:1606 length:432 start_codon:yes stop_codon:yes gene_type:complete